MYYSHGGCTHLYVVLSFPILLLMLSLPFHVCDGDGEPILGLYPERVRYSKSGKEEGQTQKWVSAISRCPARWLPSLWCACAKCLFGFCVKINSHICTGKPRQYLYSCWPKSLNLLCYFPHCCDARQIYNTLSLFFSALSLFLLISASSRSPPNSAFIIFADSRLSLSKSHLLLDGSEICCLN